MNLIIDRIYLIITGLFFVILLLFLLRNFGEYFFTFIGLTVFISMIAHDKKLRFTMGQITNKYLKYFVDFIGFFAIIGGFVVLTLTLHDYFGDKIDGLVFSLVTLSVLVNLTTETEIKKRPRFGGKSKNENIND